MKSFLPLSSKRHALFLCALAAGLFARGLAGADTMSLRLTRGPSERVSYQTANAPGPSLSFSIPGSYGFGGASVSYGAIDIDLTTISAATGYTRSMSGKGTFDQALNITATDPSLDGTQGTLFAPYLLNGSFSDPGYMGIAYFALNTAFTASEGGIYTGVLQPTPANTTVTYSGPFVFASAGSTINFHGDLSASTSTTSPNLGDPPNRAHIHISMRAGAIKLLDGQSRTVGYSSTSSSGSASARNIALGSNYSTFGLTNTIGHGTTLSLPDGIASTNQYLQAAFMAPPPANIGVIPVSDSIDVRGTLATKYVLQLSYDPAALVAAAINPADLRLAWLDPSDGKFKDAYLGNSDGGVAHQFVSGPYTGGTNFQLGNYGVDTTNHVAWAVVDHNSQFVVGQLISQPVSKVTNIQITTNGQVALTLSGAGNAQHEVDFLSDLTMTNWVSLGYIILGNNGLGMFTNNITVSTNGQRFYRLRQ